MCQTIKGQQQNTSLYISLPTPENYMGGSIHALHLKPSKNSKRYDFVIVVVDRFN